MTLRQFCRPALAIALAASIFVAANAAVKFVHLPSGQFFPRAVSGPFLHAGSVSGGDAADLQRPARSLWAYSGGPHPHADQHRRDVAIVDQPMASHRHVAPEISPMQRRPCLACLAGRRGFPLFVCEPGNAVAVQESSKLGSVSTVSSSSMSRNSSESKTSPHSRHSTNSVSSCRETMRTLGCLQMVAISLFIGELNCSFRQIVSIFCTI